MAKLTGEKPENYLPASAITVGGVYLAQNRRAYRVSRISGPHITCHMLRKTGGETKYAHTGVYGYSIFFTEVVDIPPPSVPEPPTVNRGPWSREGRTITFNGVNQFHISRSDGMSGAETDRMCERIVRLLNIQDSE